MSAKEVSPRLGRGLAALLGDIAVQPQETPQAGVTHIALDLLEPNPFQPRTGFPEEAMQELAESIRARGILQPLLVRAHPAEPGRYQIIAGERRWRAAALARLHEVPALVREMADGDVAGAAIVENLQREDLNPIEEAEGLNRLVRDFGLTHEKVASSVGKSRTHITHMLRLLKLPAPVQEAVRRGELSFGHAKALLAHPNPAAVLAQVLESGLSVRQTEALASGSEPERVEQEEKPPTKDPDTTALEKRLSEQLGYAVRISRNGRGGGMVSIRFTDLYQLDGIVERLGKD
jgi:ParB family chromosome partitioning protein